jgi:hypothetical protein
MLENWIQTLSIIITVLVTGYYLHRDIKEDMRTNTGRIDQANARTDKLYQMFIDLLKDQRKG